MESKHMIGVSLCLVILFGVSSASLYVEVKGQIHKTFDMYGLFETPCANFDDKTIKGYLYYHETGCDEVIPPPRILNRTKTSILLVANYSECILKRTLLAKQAGYKALLSFTSDDSNTSISEVLIQTGLPIAIVQSHVAETLINNATVTDDNTDTLVSISGSILAGILIVAFSFMMCFLTCCCCTLWTIICCKICLDSRRANREFDLTLGRRDDRSRQELIESILRHLQNIEEDLGAQVPLGSAQSQKIPSKKYSKTDETKEMCAICVDEFEDGEEVRVLPCNHIFHSKCIDEWLSNYSSLCPLCKANIRDGLHTNQHVTPLNDIPEDTSSFSSDGSDIHLTGPTENYGTVVR